jgi:hypothetical protein
MAIDHRSTRGRRRPRPRPKVSPARAGGRRRRPLLYNVLRWHAELLLFQSNWPALHLVSHGLPCIFGDLLLEVSQVAAQLTVPDSTSLTPTRGRLYCAARSNQSPSQPPPDGIMSDLQLTALERRVANLHCWCWVLWEGAWQSGGAARMAKWLALSSSPSQYAVAQTMLWSINGGMEILLGPLVGSLSDTFGRKWIIVFGRIGIGLIHIGYGFSTKLWHMVASECIGFGLLGAGNLATTNAAMDDMFGATPERAATISARNLMWSSITGCIGGSSEQCDSCRRPCHARRRRPPPPAAAACRRLLLPAEHPTTKQTSHHPCIYILPAVGTV